METFIDLYISVEGESVSVIIKKLTDLGFKPTIGEHDFVYKWEGIVSMDEEIKFIEKIQRGLKGTGAILKFKSVR